MQIQTVGPAKYKINMVTLADNFGDDFCLLLITFENSLDPDHDLQNVCPDLGLNCLTLR